MYQVHVLSLSIACAAAAGEHTVVMLRPLNSPEVESTTWLQPFLQDFRCRFMALLPAAFR